MYSLVLLERGGPYSYFEQWVWYITDLHARFVMDVFLKRTCNNGRNTGSRQGRLGVQVGSFK